MAYIVLILAFITGFLLVFAVNLLLADVFAMNRKRARRRLTDKLLLRQKERAQSTLADEELYEMIAAGLGEFHNKLTWTAWLRKLLDESGLSMPPKELLGLCAVTGLLTEVPLWAFSHSWIVCAVTAPITLSLPLLYVYIVRMRRREKLLSQLPEAFDLIARTLRSGQTISHGLQAVAQEFGPPIALEFGYCYDQQDLGLSPEAALRDLAQRTGLLELRVFVLVVVVHRQTGGNLAELLEKLANLIRDRYRIRGTIKALTAEGRMQGVILLSLPPAMLTAMLLMNRPYALVLFQYPALLIGIGCSMIFGTLWIRKIVHFDF
jgi:tight adherence protein B